MTVGQFLGVWGAVTVLQLAWLAFLTVKALRPGSPEQLQSMVRQLAIDVEELFGAVEKWTKRRYAAEAREKIGQQPPEAQRPADPRELKAWLRRRLRQGGAA